MLPFFSTVPLTWLRASSTKMAPWFLFRVYIYICTCKVTAGPIACKRFHNLTLIKSIYRYTYILVFKIFKYTGQWPSLCLYSKRFLQNHPKDLRLSHPNCIILEWLMYIALSLVTSNTRDKPHAAIWNTTGLVIGKCEAIWNWNSLNLHPYIVTRPSRIRHLYIEQITLITDPRFTKLVGGWHTMEQRVPRERRCSQTTSGLGSSVGDGSPKHKDPN